MKLSVFERKNLSKGKTNKIRREGNIPAVLYGKGMDNETIFVNGEEMKAILRNMESGLLATTLFSLQNGKKTHKAIIKGVEYHPTDYSILHIDFAIVHDDQPVSVNVPVQITGAAECTGIKLGGFLRQVIRSLKVICLPKKIPQRFVLDVRELDIFGSKRLSDIAVPEGVRPVGSLNEVAVVIAKRL